MKVLKIVVAIIAVICAVILIGLAYYGMFSNIMFKISKQGGETFVYEEMKGDYSQTPHLMDKIYYSLLDSEKITATKGCGIYYDDPNKVEKNKLYSEVGCIVENIDNAKLNELKQKYKVKVIPVEQCISTEFPYKGQLSVLVGLMKIYPAMNRFIEENQYSNTGAVTEIYDMPNNKIIYRKTLNNQ